VESYRKENAYVRGIQPGFDLGVPYSLVTWAQLRALIWKAGYDFAKGTGGHSPGFEVFASFPSGKLLALSAVGFNKEKTLAMVTVQFNCFPSPGPPTVNQQCYEGAQVMMEKENGRWVRAKVGTCFWVV